MTPPKAIKSEGVSDERGYTLIELLIVMTLGVIVVAGPLVFIVLSLRQQNVSSSRSVAATQEQTGLERLTRDLRQLVPGTTSTFTWTSTAASATFTLPVPGTQAATTESVTWSCAFGATGTCTRQVGTGTAVKEISNVESVSFAPVDASGSSLGGSGPSYSAMNPAYVGITVKVLDVSQLDSTGSPSHAVQGVSNWITVQGGVDLRNNSL
jgi:prepilin-type N-terminal cleavage/methylation domain-containing protein